MPKHSKKKPIVGVELRAGGGLHGPEKLGWNVGDTGQWPQKKKKMPRHSVSPKGLLLIVLLDLFKVVKMTNFNYRHKNHPRKIHFLLYIPMALFLLLNFLKIVKNEYTYIPIILFYC